MTTTTNPLAIGSLCSGYGGLDLAVESVLDARPHWFADIDTTATRIFTHHWPNTPNLGDIKTLDWRHAPPVDVITAGYPCQPFSTAGKRLGADDERHLWPFIAHGIRLLRPGLVFLENVRGHLTKGFGDVLGDLAQSGYRAGWMCLRASDVGAPHRRERIFILAAHPDVQRRDPRYQPLELQTRQPHDGRHSADPADWGVYAPAITRWGSVLGRPAPYPLAVGPRGGRRTSPAFAEWVMGLPSGHFSSLPLTSAQVEFAAGNGVVPVQAAYALRRLLPIVLDN